MSKKLAVAVASTIVGRMLRRFWFWLSWKAEKERWLLNPELHAIASAGGGVAAEAWSIDQPVRDSYLVFGSPQILEPEINEVLATLRSGWLGTGPKVAAFEAKFRAYIGAHHALALNSCTAALHLSMLAIGLQPGDEVIVPSMTFASTANLSHPRRGQTRAGRCRPPDDVFGPRRYGAADHSSHARVIPVHFAGRACDMDAILELALVTDCALSKTAPTRSKRSTTAGTSALWATWDALASTSPRTW
jgi:dTDP-4-amino-4,6-dideoxygalactose transaminase